MAATPDVAITTMAAELALPRSNGELVFAAPWEARAFGLAVALHEAGLYPWRHFSQGLAVETAVADRHDHPASYYERWIEALEKLVLAQGLVTRPELEARITAYAYGAHDEHVGRQHHAP